MIKIILLSIITSLSLTLLTHEEDKVNTILSQTSIYEDVDANGVTRKHYITPMGLECYEVIITDYSRSGLGVTCNWEKYNKEQKEKK